MQLTQVQLRSERTTTANYTYTQNGGGYSINKKYPFSDSSSINAIGFAAPGGETFWDDSFDELNQPTSMYNCSLKFRPFKYDGWFDDITIPSFNTRNLKAWDTLLVYNVTIQNNAVSEIKARNGVTIYGEFMAELGSDVYIYCTATFSDCDDFNFSRDLKSAFANSGEEPSKEDKTNEQIEITFVPVAEFAFLDVFPNPGNGQFTLNLRTNKESYSLIQIHVYDITGSCVYKNVINENISNLDLSFLSSGIYYLHAKSVEDSFNQKLIIQ